MILVVKADCFKRKSGGWGICVDLSEVGTREHPVATFSRTSSREQRGTSPLTASPGRRVAANHSERCLDGRDEPCHGAETRKKRFDSNCEEYGIVNILRSFFASGAPSRSRCHLRLYFWDQTSQSYANAAWLCWRHVRSVLCRSFALKAHCWNGSRPTLQGKMCDFTSSRPKPLRWRMEGQAVFQSRRFRRTPIASVFPLKPKCFLLLRQYKQ